MSFGLKAVDILTKYDFDNRLKHLQEIIVVTRLWLGKGKGYKLSSQETKWDLKLGKFCGALSERDIPFISKIKLYLNSE